MSAVSAPFPMPSPEPAAPRRRAAEADAGREAAPFSLPSEPAAEKQPAVADKAPEAKASEPTTQKPGQQDGGASEPKAAQAAPTKPAAVQGPAQPAPVETPAPAIIQPKPDVGALVAIAEAEQAATSAIGETVAKPKKVEGEGKADSETKTDTAGADGGDIVAALPLAMPDPATATPAPAAPALPAAGNGTAQQPAAAADPASPDAPTAVAAAGTQGTGGQQSGIQVEMVSVATVPEMPPGPPGSGPAGEPAPEHASAPATAPDKALRLDTVKKLPIDLTAFGLTGTSSPGAEVPVAKGTAEAKPTDAAGTSHAKAAKGEDADTSAATAATTAPGEIVKPAEQAPQQPATPALHPVVLAHAGKPDSVAAPSLDQTATTNAQQQLSNGQHNAADGPPTPLHVVPVEIGLRALAGSKRFDIRLDPAELGRVDVKLEISDKGEVSAKLVVDRVETLHLLQRDARTLERAFEQAGLKPSDAGVDITLRDQGDQSSFRQNRQDEQAPRHARSAPAPEIDDVSAAIAAQPTPIRRFVRLGGVDLSI